MRLESTVYCDYQASTPIDPAVLAQMPSVYRNQFGNPHSNNHLLGWTAHELVENAAGAVGSIIGCDSDDIVFTSGATESNNLALWGLARSDRFRKKRRLIVSPIEHKCVLAAADAIARHVGLNVEYVPVDREGVVDIDYLANSIDDDVLVVSIMAVNNEIGTIEPINKIGEIAQKHNVLLHCDAAQAPDAIDIRQIISHVDLLSLSAHKMYGPKGIGALYIRRDIQPYIEPFIYGGGQQNGIRSGTIPAPLCAGFGTAAQLIIDHDHSQYLDQIKIIRDMFLDQLTANDIAYDLVGPATSGHRHPGNANITLTGFVADQVLLALQPWVAASTSAACTTGIPEPSHVMKATGWTDGEVRVIDPIQLW